MGRAPSEHDRRSGLLGCERLAAPSASAVDVYSFANGCYGLRDLTHKSLCRPGRAWLLSHRGDRRGRDAVSHAGDGAGALPPLRP